jgi:hypothetical protein
MKVYKLVRKMKDGSLSSLFINKKSRFSIGKWIDSEPHPTKGFAFRQGWHCTLKPEAPHLSKMNRVWVEAEVQDYEYFARPDGQGGLWVLAQKIKILKEVD